MLLRSALRSFGRFGAALALSLPLRRLHVDASGHRRSREEDEPAVAAASAHRSRGERQRDRGAPAREHQLNVDAFLQELQRSEAAARVKREARRELYDRGFGGMSAPDVDEDLLRAVRLPSPRSQRPPLSLHWQDVSSFSYYADGALSGWGLLPRAPVRSRSQS